MADGRDKYRRGGVLIAVGGTLAAIGLVVMPGATVNANSLLGDVLVFGGAAVAARGVALRRRPAHGDTPDPDPGPAEAGTEPLRPPSRLQKAATRPRVLARLQDAASSFMGPGETIRLAFYGQTGMPTGFVFLGVAAGKAQMVTVAATDRNVYVFRRGLRAKPRVLGLIATYRIDSSIRVGLRQGAVDIEGETYWISALIAQQEARAFVAYVRSAASAMRAAQASTPTPPPMPS